MIPKKLSEEEMRGAFERILKTPEHISHLTQAEAKEFLDLAKNELNAIVIKTSEFEALEHLKKAKN
jgi:hypothetical protein